MTSHATTSQSHAVTSRELYSAVYGTVLASALLAALQRDGDQYTPYYDAVWVLVTATTAALAHGYANHMATHRKETPGHRWQGLLRHLWEEWPLVAAALPTVALLLASGAFGWPEGPSTLVGLGVDAAMLFGLGVLAARRSGYGRGGAVLVGAADLALGVLIASANAVIK
ncbi:hypothetical protein [Streptomyces gilvosporeus]|uniref:hypothetical protein n=1 Tax=Streptomyces gilvosporeus TaxID=553510 RepID=UPI001F43411B|nr:hypothetical protein [Streptomyces gilvosporeus]